MSSRKKRIRDTWRSKRWYTVLAPPYFGNVELGAIPADEQKKLIGRIIESTLYEITSDFSHQYLKIFFQVNEVNGKNALTIFKGHEYSRDYLRSLVRRRTTKIDGFFNITTKDGYKIRVAAFALTISRIRTSQEKKIRTIMGKIVNEKSSALTLDQFAQEVVLGKISSDVYKETKKIVPLRHVGIRKSKLIKKLVPVQKA